MKVVMIGVNRKTEKNAGIANYTEEVIGAIKNNGIKIYHVCYDLGSLKSLIGIIPKVKNFDIIHIQHEYGLFGSLSGLKFIPFFLLLKLSAKGKIVTTMHTIHKKDENLLPNIWWWSWLKKNIIYPIENRVIGLSDIIVFHTDYLGKIMRTDYGVNEKKIVTIPHGVRNDVPKYKKIFAKQKLGIKSKLYLMIGNIGYSKGFDIITDQAKEIGGEIRIVGNAIGEKNKKYFNDLKKDIKKKRLDRFVKIDDSDINSKKEKWWLYFSAADIVFLPYRVMTTSGIFINAMQTGKPVIGCDSDYFREVYSKYDCIKIAKRKSDYPKLIKVVLKSMKDMKKESRRFSKDVSLNVIGKKYKKLYENLIKLQ